MFPNEMFVDGVRRQRSMSSIMNETPKRFFEVSRLESLTLALERASERANALRHQSASEYAQIVAEVEDIIRQLQAVIAEGEFGVWVSSYGVN
jgi:hypothetical protein